MCWLYTCNSGKFFICSNSFFFKWIPSDFLYTRSCHLQTEIFYFCLSNLGDFCVILLPFVVLARTSSSMLNGIIFIFFLILEKFSIMEVVCFSYVSFIRWKTFSSLSSLLSSFYQKRVFDFVKVFFPLHVLVWSGGVCPLFCWYGILY